MAKYRMVRVDFWKNPVVSEQMTPEDKYFYLYLLTNPHTTQIGIYKITKKQLAFDLGYTIESVQALMERFIEHYQLIRYNPETSELAIRNWGKYKLHKGGKPVMDCISSELKEVEDYSLIQYVAASIDKQEILSLYEAFYKQAGRLLNTPFREEDESDSPEETECEEFDDVSLHRNTIRGQKEKEIENEYIKEYINEYEKEKQQQQNSRYPNVVVNPNIENSLKMKQESEDIKEIVEFWDTNGFGITNINAKQQLLTWLMDSNFLQPKDMIIKAMMIACANNTRRLTYVMGILKNWENDSLLTVKETELYEVNFKPVPSHRQSNRSLLPGGRDIPSGFKLDLTAGEDW